MPGEASSHNKPLRKRALGPNRISKTAKKKLLKPAKKILIKTENIKKRTKTDAKFVLLSRISVLKTGNRTEYQNQNNCIVFLVKAKNQILIQDTCKPKKTKSE